MHPLPIPEGRFEAWSMDFIFGLPEAGGYTGVMTVVDRLTKLVRLTPCTQDITAEGAAQLFFDRVIRDFGVPKTVVSDRDPRFVSAFWKALMSSLGTKLLYSTAFHPQTDGQTERAHRVIEQVLRSYVAAGQSGGWHSQLGQCEFALNSAVQASTGISPFEMVYGAPVREPLDHVEGVADVPVARDLADRVRGLVAEGRRSLA